MKRLTSLFLGGLLVSACGGGSGGITGVTVSPLAFAGTFSVTDPVPVDAPDTCKTTTTVTFHADGTDIHTAALTGGDCLKFVNADTGLHRPASFGAPACPALDAPAALAKDGVYTTPPMGAPAGTPATCQWQDRLHPIPTGGGGGY